MMGIFCYIISQFRCIFKTIAESVARLRWGVSQELQRLYFVPPWWETATNAKRVFNQP
jgi:hypothetical protein